MESLADINARIDRSTVALWYAYQAALVEAENRRVKHFLSPWTPARTEAGR